jgi:hypothetical protein
MGSWFSYQVFAFPAYVPNDWTTPSGVLLYRTNGQPFPAVAKSGLKERKTHNIGGGHDGLVVCGTPGQLAAATTVWTFEGIPDLCSWGADLPDGHIAVTNICGCNSFDDHLTEVFKGKAAVRIVGDADQPGQHGARLRGRAALAAGVGDVRLVQLPYTIEQDHGKDARDYRNDGHSRADLLALADSAPLLTAADVADIAAPDDDERPSVLLTTDEHTVNDQVVAALAKDETIFQRAGLLVHIVCGMLPNDGIVRGVGAPTIAQLPEALLRERMTRAVRFFQKSGDSPIPGRAHPPAWCVKAIASRGQWAAIRHLLAVVPSPVLRPDGTILQGVGYDDRTALYCADSAGVVVPENPSREDALKALEMLVDVVHDFPFAQLSHCAAWVAFVLTPLARHSFAGPAPLTLVDANVRGSGKTLLCSIASLIAYGRDIARMSNPTDDDEARKRITALAIAGDPLVLIDNIVGTLGCASLDAALTATVWKDRILGASRMVELPLSVTWCASGNNVMLAADTMRRTLHVRLESQLENPEQRTGFKYSNVSEHVLANRSRLLSAALTILRAYCYAGRPRHDLPAWGSFEGWSALVREAVVWLGMPDPAGTRQELAAVADTEASALAQLLESWPEIDPNNVGLTTAELLGRLDADHGAFSSVRAAIVELCPPDSGPLPTVRQLGNRLSRLRRRIVGGKSLDYRKRGGRQRAWRLVSVNPGQGDSSDSSDSV